MLLAQIEEQADRTKSRGGLVSPRGLEKRRFVLRGMVAKCKFGDPNMFTDREERPYSGKLIKGTKWVVL